MVLLDLTDPETPAGPLYTTEFFESCKAVLKPGGAVVLHIGAPFYEPAQISSMLSKLGHVFEQVSPFGLHIPLYGAYWGLVVVSDSLAPKTVAADVIEQRLLDRDIADLQYYNSEIHGALFALPNYYKNLVPELLTTEV